MAMKWIPLDGKKEPDFNERVLMMNAKGEWDSGCLSEIITTEKGKKYLFNADDEGHQWTDITHYMIIEPPKNNT